MSTTDETTGWRAVLTPRERASRRRWTAFYALLLTAIGLGALDGGVRDAVEDDGRGLLSFVVLLIVFGMLRRGTRRLTATDHPELDERDRRARDRAFRLAMPVFFLVVLATVLALPAALDAFDQGSVVTGRRDPYAGRTSDGWILDWNAVIVLVGWFALWAVFLPTAVVAWREPDALEDEDAPVPPIAPVTRDLVLACGFVGATALSFAGSILIGFVLLAGTIAVLWARAHRSGAGGGPRPLAVGALVSALLVLLALGFALGAGSGGDSAATGPATVAAGGDRLPPGVTRWQSQYETTCLVVKAATGADLDRRDARARQRRLGLDTEELCRF